VDQYTTYVAFDTSKETLAVAIAESGRHKEVRFFGAIASRPEAVHKLIDKLAMQHPRPAFCYGAGPTGYGLYRQIRAIGYECRVVVAPMVPVRPGGHIKTDRRDATTLAALFRAGELTAILSVGLASRLRCSDQPGPQQKLAASHVHVRFLSIRLYIAPRFHRRK
jgi:transposase